MPDDVICFFDVKNANDFNVLLKDQPIFTPLEDLFLFGELKNDILLLNKLGSTKAELLSDLQNKNFLAGAFASGQNAVDYLFLLQLSEAGKIRLSEFLPELDDEKPTAIHHKFERTDIYELSYKIHGLKIAVAKVQGILIISTSTVLVENSILQLKTGNPVTGNKAFKDVYDKIDKKRNYSFYINIEQLADYFSVFSTNDKYNEIMQLKDYVSWMGLGLEFKDSGILMNGYASANGESANLSLNNYSGEFNVDMHEAVPSNTVALFRINSKQLTENIALKFPDEKINRNYFDFWSPWMGEQLIFGISETLNQQYMKKAFLIIPATDQKLAADKLKYCTLSDSLKYNGYRIMELAAGDIVSGISGVKYPEKVFACWYKNNLILTFEKLQLETIIESIENGESLKDDKDYDIFKSEISTSFNNSIYINLSKSEHLIKSFISDKMIDSVSKKFDLLQKYSMMEIQFSNNKNIVLVNGFIRYNAVPKRKGGGLWKAEMDHVAEAGPFTVFNQLTKQKNIIVQDTAHQMYLFSANGEILWKQVLNSKIMGGLNEVDFYGNNKNQLLFNTADAIYLLDMNGNPVEGFPITLTSRTTNPLSVLMNRKNDYQMFVACENENIYGFYKDGKPISGWNPLKNAGQVEWPLFEIRGKDEYIAYINNSGVQVKKQNGNAVKSLLLPNKTIALNNSNNLNYLLDDKGNVAIIDQDLIIDITKGSDKFITGNFARVNAGDTLDIIVLEDGYFKAKTISGKSIFVAEAGIEFQKVITSTFGGEDFYGMASEGKIILFSDNGKLLENFPLRGSEKFLVDDLTSNGDKMLITLIGNMVIAYRIQ